MDAVRIHRLAVAGLAALAALLAVPAAGDAATQSFGSPLSVPATLDTAANLNYRGTDIPTIDPGPPPRPVVVHINHDGADTALWPKAIAGRAPAAPASGQVLSVRLEGCAVAAAGGPAPNVQIHFQTVAPQPDGSFRVVVTSQAFDVPVCGSPLADGSPASGSTVSSYAPTNLCVRAGEALAFNDEGGFDPNAYPSGVAFRVLGAVPGSSTYSFIRNNGTNNGAVFSPSDQTNHDGFADNAGSELMLQATLGTGSDATPLCPGGTSGVKAPAPQAGQPGGPPALVIHPQTDGVNHARWVGLAVYCAKVGTPCTGAVTVLAAGTGAAKATILGRGQLGAPAQHTVHVRLRLTRSALALIRHHRRRLAATMSVRMPDGSTFSQAITLKI
jgi:hypothetical protein